MKKVKVLIACDQALIREGLSTIFNSQDKIEIIGEAENGKNTVKNHLTKIFQKLGVDDRTQAALHAVKSKMVDLY